MMDDSKMTVKTALGEFDTMRAPPKLTCNLPLTPEEMVALHAHLAMMPSFNGRAAIISRLGEALTQALRRAVKTDQVLKIAEKLAVGMQAELYLKKQERKIAELKGTDSCPQTDGPNDDEREENERRGDGEMVDIDLDAMTDDQFDGYVAAIADDVREDRKSDGPLHSAGVHGRIRRNGRAEGRRNSPALLTPKRPARGGVCRGRFPADFQRQSVCCRTTRCTIFCGVLV